TDLKNDPKAITYSVAQIIRDDTRFNKEYDEKFWEDPNNIREIFDQEFHKGMSKKDNVIAEIDDVFVRNRLEKNLDVKSFLWQVEGFLRHAFDEDQPRKDKEQYEKEKVEVEHIWGKDDSDKNDNKDKVEKEAKETNNVPDERTFGEIKEDIGAKLLLEETINKSIQNERYLFKRDGLPDKPEKSYRESNFIWTQILNPIFVKEYEDHIVKLRETYDIFDDEDFQPVEDFTYEAKEQREKTLAKIVQIIWADNTLDANGDPNVKFYWWK
ncbi:MAG: DUF1524 domain-containing protein, partial [Cytophagales bacterium]|nr:DUF1524 domain-containing protein [Cytophagales bacterium]